MSAGVARMWAPVVASALIAAGCSTSAEPTPADVVPADIAEVGALVVATDPTFPPAQFRSPVQFQSVLQGELTGFEVELVEAVADELGLDVEWQDVAFDDVLGQLSLGVTDLAAASITVTDERAARYTFVTFFESATQWAAREPNTTGITPDDACGARVAVQVGTIQEDDLAERSSACEDAGNDPIKVRLFERQDEASAAVLAGAADAYLADAPAVQWDIQQYGATQNPASTVANARLSKVGAPYDLQPYGWAVRDDALAEALLEGLQAVYDSGEYDSLLRFWGVEDGAIDQFAIVGSG
jgi:polar amino acid transport system substrate-binding protein